MVHLRTFFKSHPGDPCVETLLNSLMKQTLSSWGWLWIKPVEREQCAPIFTLLCFYIKVIVWWDISLLRNNKIFRAELAPRIGKIPKQWNKTNKQKNPQTQTNQKTPPTTKKSPNLCCNFLETNNENELIDTVDYS